MTAFEKVIVVTRKTPLEELVERFNTREQARFYIEHMGASFAEYQEAHDVYRCALQRVRAALPSGVRHQFVERSFLPNFTFGGGDLVVTLGQDGLVVNTAKYLSGQPLLAFNPDRQRIDGVLIPFPVEAAEGVLRRVLTGQFVHERICMAEATLNDGQRLVAVNDLFIGQRTHQSARYRLSLEGEQEDQSSSGIIVSTGAGSTGWWRSVLTGASCVMETFSGRSREMIAIREMYRFNREAVTLRFCVREPFISRTSSARLVIGSVELGQHLEITSLMPQNGVIFSDGIEEDYLPFNSGAIARIGVADQKVHLIVKVGG
ncbi:MAG TPA: hypothetical protein VKU00_30995 [Chthonomonadaceae bacterium]|nr:hypothetical protein [Chthonomonadaceae bacterium]